MYRHRIAKLQQRAIDLDKEILKAEKNSNFNVDALKAMLVDRNDVYSEIRRYTKLQWDEDHERVNFEDDR
jgi:hypothetical protein